MIVEPSRPEGPLVINDVTDDSVSLSWKPPLEDNGGIIQGYIIEAKDVSLMDVRKKNFWSEGQSTSYEVAGLETSHIYQFRVYAQNEAGRSEGLLNKTLVRIKLKSKKPPKPSRPLAMVKGDDAVFLEWSVPGNFAGLCYLIERAAPHSELWMQCNKGVVLATNFLVTGLSSGGEFRFRVSTENDNGVSAPSEESNIVCLSVEGEAPQFSLPLKDCYVKTGESSSFVCEYSGTPSITADWTKDNIRVRTGTESTIRTTVNKSELEIAEIDSDDDDSNIRCTLRNEFGHVSSEAKIKLLSPPEIRCPSSYKDGLTYDSGESARLRVTFSGKPLPDVTVFFNERKISSNNEKRELLVKPDSIEVRIQDLCGEDSGVYKFVAQNTLGKDELEVAIKVSGPPDPPDGIPTLECVENEAIMNWNTPLENGGSDVYNYIIEKKLPETNIWTRFGSTHKTTIVLGLVNDIEDCTFRIKAENIYGVSEPSLDTHVSREKICFPVLAEKTDSTILFTNTIEKINTPNTADNKEILSTELLNNDAPNYRTIEMGKFLSNLEINLKDFNTDSQQAVTHEIETPSVLFAASQTLLSPMVLNFACSCTEVFSETFSFSTEASPELKHLTVAYENHKINIPRVVSVHFESINQFVHPNYPPENATSCLIPEVNFLIVDQADIFLSLFYTMDITESNTFPIWIWFDENMTQNGLFSCDNEVEFDFAHFKYFPQPILFVLVPPIVLEFPQSLPIYIPNKEKAQLSVKLCESLIVSFIQPFEMSNKLLRQIANHVKTSVVTCSATDYDELISISSVPITTFKPALSVLPFVRETPKSSKISIDPEYNLKDNILPKRRGTTESTCESVNIPNHDEIVSKSSASYEMEVFQKPWEKMSNVFDTELEHFSVEDITWKCPDWLKSVSPSYIPEIELDSRELSETLLEFEAVALDDRTPDQPLSEERLRLKEKSVEELLLLAQEVEKRFSQKTEQIESLENILQTELFSLEKDLETVSEIHKNLNDSRVILETDAGMVVSHEESPERSFLGKELIDFDREIPPSTQRGREPSQYAPEVIVHLQNRVIQTGCRTRLYCSITGDPEPEVVWKKNGKVLPQSSRYFSSNLVEFGQYLDVYNAKSTDSGLYSCVATNPLGTTQTQAYLRVIGRREISPVEPAFVTSPDDISAQIAETVDLEWKITGTPSPHVIWFKNAERIETNLHVSTFSNHRGCCRITLHSVDVSDSAIYTCYLENEAGSAVSTALLTVSDELSSQPVNPSIIPTFCAKDLVSKDSFQNQYQNRSDESIDQTETFCSKPSREKTAMECSLPGPPFAPRVLSAGQGWVILCWAAPLTNGFDRDLEYLVEKRLLHSSQWSEMGWTRATVYTAHGLAGGKSYVFRISARNHKGKGLPVTMQEPVHFASK